MRKTSLFPSVLAITCVAGLTGCVVGTPEGDAGDESVGTQEEAATGATLGVCYNGSTTKVKKIDPTAKRCTLAQLSEMVSYTCAHEPEVCNFLMTHVDGHAHIQCTAYTAGSTTKYCADVIDRNPDGSTLEDAKDWQNPPYSRNFYIGYAIDTFYPTHPDVPYWTARLGDPTLQAAPVSLDFAGRLDSKPTFFKAGAPQPPLDNRQRRLFKFDPRSCGGCGLYNGPNSSLADPVEISSGWWPGFDSTACAYQQNSAQPYASWFGLGADPCNAEYAYRLTGRR